MGDWFQDQFLVIPKSMDAQVFYSQPSVSTDVEPMDTRLTALTKPSTVSTV